MNQDAGFVSKACIGGSAIFCTGIAVMNHWPQALIVTSEHEKLLLRHIIMFDDQAKHRNARMPESAIQLEVVMNHGRLKAFTGARFAASVNIYTSMFLRFIISVNRHVGVNASFLPHRFRRQSKHDIHCLSPRGKSKGLHQSQAYIRKISD